MVNSRIFYIGLLGTVFISTLYFSKYPEKIPFLGSKYILSEEQQVVKSTCSKLKHSFDRVVPSAVESLPLNKKDLLRKNYLKYKELNCSQFIGFQESFPVATLLKANNVEIRYEN